MCPFSKVVLLACTLCTASVQGAVQMLVPGFKVEELPLELSNQNNLRFAPDGTLTALGYDGRIWRLVDTDGDKLEDKALPYWDKPTLSVPLGMNWSTHGLLVASKGKISLLRDDDGDGAADREEVVTSGWTSTDVGSGGVDATAVTMDAEGNLYFGLLVADYANAYRLRQRKDLKPEEVLWLKANNKWREPSGGRSGEDEFSLYDLNSKRGTIQKWNPRTKELTTVATGIRVPVALAFNAQGDLFNTDQEGETWMPEGNPLDELNHIVQGKNYGFPPPHPRWLPNTVVQQPVAMYGPQHQSACGLVFNLPRVTRAIQPPGEIPLPVYSTQGLFGPSQWNGNAFVAGESRGKIYRTELIKTPAGYVGRSQTIARLSMLTVDMAISPRGEMYVACHSGPPDWGTGPKGKGKIFKLSYSEPSAPILVSAAPESVTEVRLRFETALHAEVVSQARAHGVIEFGEYVSAGDKYETLKPPYVVVGQQDATPRGKLRIQEARLEEGGKTLVLKTDPHPLAVRYAVTLPEIRSASQAEGTTMELEYDFLHSTQPLKGEATSQTHDNWNKLVGWAPKGRASSGTNSRPPNKPDGDWEHGRELFFSTELNCAKCHRIRGEGGLAGPDLSNLLHRDSVGVLQDILEPSATIHPDYATYQVELKDGEPVQGFIRSQEAAVVRLFDAEGKETNLKRSEITELKPTELSLMPKGLLEGRGTNDVRDLLTFLLWAPPKVRPPTDHANATPSRQNPRAVKFVLVASKQDHGKGQHDYPAWQEDWLKALNDPSQKLAAEKAWEWPTAPQFESANVMVFYYWNRQWTTEKLEQLSAFVKRGGGLMLIHSAVISDNMPEALASIIGLSAHPQRTGYRHMPFELVMKDRAHPITKGLPERLEMLDEPYWPLIGDPSKVRLLASAQVDGGEQPLVWVREIEQGRIFCSVPGHYTWSHQEAVFRTMLWRALAWVSRVEPHYLETR